MKEQQIKQINENLIIITTLIFCLFFISWAYTTYNFVSNKDYPEECIESHVKNTFTYKGCVVTIIFNNGTTDCDNNYERINTFKTTCTKYALVRNATQEELSQ